MRCLGDVYSERGEEALRTHAPVDGCFISNRHDGFSKGHQRNFYELKMLAGKRNADDGDKKQQAENNMADGDPQAAANDPENIQQQRQTAAA